MIEIGQGITIEQGITMGNVSALPMYFVTEITEDYFITETGDYLVEE